MNDDMYGNKIVQDNTNKLKDYGYEFIDSDVGNLACGYKEIGKLANNDKIIEYLKNVLED